MKNNITLARFPRHEEADKVIAVYQTGRGRMKLVGYYAGAVGRGEFLYSKDISEVKVYSRRSANTVLSRLRSKYPEVGTGASNHNWRFVLKDIETLNK